MYVQVVDFCISRGPSTVPLTQISQNQRKAGTLYVFMQEDAHVCISHFKDLGMRKLQYEKET